MSLIIIIIVVENVVDRHSKRFQIGWKRCRLAQWASVASLAPQDALRPGTPGAATYVDADILVNIFRSVSVVNTRNVWCT